VLTLFMRSIVCSLIIMFCPVSFHLLYVCYNYIYVYVYVYVYWWYKKSNKKKFPLMWARPKRKWVPNPTLHLHLKLSNTYKAHSSKCFLGFKSCAHKFFAQRYTHFLCRWGNGYSLPTLLYRKHNNQWQR